MTQSCGCLKRDSKKHGRWNGYGDISGGYWCRIRERTKLSGRVFDITIEYAWELYQKQGGKCALSGVPLIMKLTYKDHDVNTASLDRIDSDKGYVQGNVQWVHKYVNRMKGDLPEVYFIEFCRLISVYHNKTGEKS